MATIDYLHVCDYAFADQGGKPCIIGIFDVIHAVTFPAMHPMMAVAMRIRGNPHELVQLKIELSRPNGEVLATIQGENSLSPDGSAFMQMNMAGLTFPEAGRYVIKVSSAGKTLTSHSLHLMKMQAPPQAPPQGTPSKMN
jgi:uncharacterized protein DUF6941